MIVEMLVVHPTYWRRGHGKVLIKGGLTIAGTDGVKSGVFAMVMGELMYCFLGYVRAWVIGLKDEKQPLNEVGAVVLSDYGGDAI